MSEKVTSNNINETHLGYIQNAITRMGQNSFHAKTWCITIISALLVFYFTQTQDAARPDSIIAAIAAVVLFGVLDVYYLYLERGYRYLYDLVAGIKTSSEPVKPYDMRIPKSERRLRKYLSAILSPSTGLFYLAIILLLFVLWGSTCAAVVPAV